MPMATIHVSAFNNPGDAEAPAPTRDRIRFSVLADVSFTYSRATDVSPEEYTVNVSNVRHMDVEFDVASTDFSCEDGESWQGDRAGDTYDWEFTDSDSALKFLEAWGIELEDELEWDFDGPDGPDPDDQRDAMLEEAWSDREADMIDDAYERHVQQQLRETL